MEAGLHSSHFMGWLVDKIKPQTIQSLASRDDTSDHMAHPQFDVIYG